MAKTKQAEQAEQAETQATDNGEVQVEFLGTELPKVRKTGRDSGVWTQRLAPLRDNPGQWAIVHRTEPGKQHAAVNSLKRGAAAGISGYTEDGQPTEFEFAGRTIDGQGAVLAKFLG